LLKNNKPNPFPIAKFIYSSHKIAQKRLQLFKL